jgi:hypothetical protein
MFIMTFLQSPVMALSIMSLLLYPAIRRHTSHMMTFPPSAINLVSFLVKSQVRYSFSISSLSFFKSSMSLSQFAMILLASSSLGESVLPDNCWSSSSEKESLILPPFGQRTRLFLNGLFVFVFIIMPYVMSEFYLVILFLACIRTISVSITRTSYF